MRLPNRPETIGGLQGCLSAGELCESRAVEFKRELPSNKSLAKQIAGFAVEGGVLVVGVAECASGFHVVPVDCDGARERVEQVAHDIPEPPVQIDSYVLQSDVPGHGVLWVEIPPSQAMLHQVDGTYYERGDTQTRPMRDADVADRMGLRRRRADPVLADLEEALERDEPGATAWQGRTCVVARPIGAADQEFYESTRSHAEWETFARQLNQLQGPLARVSNKYWGIFASHSRSDAEKISDPVNRFYFRDVEFH